jgi:hypothetical protein
MSLSLSINKLRRRVLNIDDYYVINTKAGLKNFVYNELNDPNLRYENVSEINITMDTI